MAHFNTLTTANDQAGPNIINNAYHPNQRGHEFTYKPAILDTLQAKLDDSALVQIACDEGLKPAATPAPDLTFAAGSPTFSYDFENRILSLAVTVVNLGNVSSPADTAISLALASRNPSQFEAELLPILDIGQTHTFTREIELPPTTLLDALPYQCPSAPFEGFEAFEGTDEALLYFLSTEEASFQITIDPNQSLANEINTQNNSSSIPVSVSADTSSISADLENILADLEGLLGQTVSTVDFALLVTSKDVRSYFGFYSRELDELRLSFGQAFISQQTATLDRCVALALGLNPPNPADPQPKNDLRPICLFPPPESDCPDNSLARDPQGELRTYEEIIANAPRDGRSIILSALADEQLAELLGEPLIDIEYSLPSITGGIEFPSESNPLTSQSPSFNFSSIAGATGYALTLGTTENGSDILTSTLIDP
ncbi:MAG: hypothetical protein AAF357_17940, partial [Verrucomicrobiota bacterium]